MNNLDFSGHLFYASLFLGMLLLQAKDYRGWALRFIGEAGWIGIGFIIGYSSIILWGFAFMAVDVLGYSTWRKEQKIQAMKWREDTEYLWDDCDDTEYFWGDCDGKIHVPGCRHFKPIEDGTCITGLDEVIVYDPLKSIVKKEKKNVRKNAKAKAKRNPPVKLESERSRVAKTNRKTPNRKVRAGGRRPRK
jgi:hypothetical protein